MCPTAPTSPRSSPTVPTILPSGRTYEAPTLTSFAAPRGGPRLPRGGPAGVKMIKVFLCDDHALIRRGIRDTLSDAPDIEVIGEAGDYGELRSLLPPTAGCACLGSR